MASFSFSFSGEDIEADDHENGMTTDVSPAPAATISAVPPASVSAAASAFPVQGRPQLPPCRHSLRDMLARLPSKVAYGMLDVQLEADKDGDRAISSSSPGKISLPRRELWDVRVQVMAEADADADDEDSHDSSSGEIAPGLGTHDVKTGIYEGGFKSWESSVDLVKVLLRSAALDEMTSATGLSAVAADVLSQQGPAQVLELGCGTALPSLALFQWACALRAPPPTADAGKSQDQTDQADQANQANPAAHSHRLPLSLTVADYNPSVLHLVTLPNLILVWALQRQHVEPALLEALSEEDDPDSGGELELTDAVKDAFCAFLKATNISLTFLSGGWSPAFTDLLYADADADADAADAADAADKTANTLVLGAETIYSPFALEAFSDTLLAILGRVRGAGAQAAAIIGAKKLYFGVGGSLDDFVRRMRDAGAQVSELREEADGVRRGVVQCLLA